MKFCGTPWNSTTYFEIRFVKSEIFRLQKINFDETERSSANASRVSRENIWILGDHLTWAIDCLLSAFTQKEIFKIK